MTRAPSEIPAGRSIKFKAWDIEKKKWIEGNAYHVLSLMAVESNWNRFVFVQFTGLLDKNGKEIYEGDIFQQIGGKGTDMMQGEVYFEKGCFRMKYGYQTPGERRKDYFLSSAIGDNSVSMEIIGNIYENPELIEKSV